MLSILKLPQRELIENRLREKTTDINNTVDIYFAGPSKDSHSNNRKSDIDMMQ